MRWWRISEQRVLLVILASTLASRTVKDVSNFLSLPVLLVGNLTSCQKRQKVAMELSSSGPNIWNFIPRCRADGGYHEIQCHVGTGQCWCVDINGNEIWGTTAQGLPDCIGL